MKHLFSGLVKLTATSALVVSIVACGGADERKVTYLEKGKAYLAENNDKKARIEFKNVLQIDPKFSDAYYYMGILSTKDKAFSKAIGNYRKAIELDPAHTLAKVKLAKIFVIGGTESFIKEANKLLAKARLEQPDLSEIDLIEATIKYKTGSKAEAVSDIETVLSKDPSLVEGVSLLASIYLAEGKEDKAIDILTKGTLEDAYNIPLRITLAKLLAKNKDYKNAEKYLKQVILLEPEEFYLQLELSSFYVTSNQLDKAESVLRKAIEQNSEDASRYLVLVELISSKVSLEEGEKELKLAINKNPDLYELKFYQAKFYEKFGQRNKSKEVLQHIVEEKGLEVQGINARVILTKYLLQEGDKKSARKYIDEILAEHPNNNDALIIVSKLRLDNLDVIEAINGLRTVVKNDPQNTEASMLLAQAHVLNGDNVLAENSLKQSIESNPANAQSHVNYVRYLASMGRVDEAVTLIDKSLTHFKDSYDLLETKLKMLGTKGSEKQINALLNLMEQAEPGKAEVNISRGQYYISKKKFAKAIEQFEMAYTKSTDKYKPLELITKSYIYSNQSDQALNRLQQLVDKNPEDAIAIQLMGNVYLQQKNIDKAVAEFKKASLIAEAWFLPYSSIASTYMSQDKVQMAIKVYQDALPKLKNKLPAQMQLASIYENKKEFSTAMELYKTILEDQPSNKLAANNYASLLLDFGSKNDIPKALELSKGFEKLKQPALRDTLAWAYAKSGDNVKAVELLKPVVEKLPKIAVFRYHLGYALYHTGDKQAAKSHLDVAISSDQKFAGKDKAQELLKTI